MIKNKTSIIKKVMLSKLQEEGFEYQGYKNKSWLFRKKGEVNLEIIILEYRYDPSYFTLLLSWASAIPASKLDSSEKLLGEYFHVENDDEFEALMEYFLELIESKGLAELEKVSTLSPEYKLICDITREIYANRAEIYEDFIAENKQLPINEYSMENIEVWFDFIEKNYSFYRCADITKFSENDEKEFKEVVVFLSTMLEKNLSGVWVLYDYDSECAVLINEIHSVDKVLNVIAVVLGMMEQDGFQIAKAIFEDICKKRTD